jgi:capsular exopolysaccharide synthesis family protein
VSKIFEALNTADNEPMRHINGGRSAITSETADVSGGRAPQQVASSGTAVADGFAPRTSVGLTPDLEMDQATRQELTRLTHMLFLNSGGYRVVAFSGVESGAGCSWIVVRIAQLLAEAGAGSVCIVDANFQSPMLHTYLDADNSRGLSDALVEPHPVTEYLQRLGGVLHLLSTGSEVSKAESLLASSAFRGRVEQLRAYFDFVLFDTPALAVSSDALAIASTIDGLAMVVEADATNRETAFKAAKDAAAANVRMLGVVLNKRTYPIPEAIYSKL